MSRLSWLKTFRELKEPVKSRILNLAEQQSKEVRREVNGLVALACDGAPAKTKLDLGSLCRVSRSSLNSEAQACAGAMDAFECLTVFWQVCLSPTFTLQEPASLARFSSQRWS